ncbi:MAG TPA: hypothetical protein VFX65_02695 [Candidatus Limnocylindrales bacterium]|nr:hypothetical protein [Candidatus Limnocylindrales bacterium]
MPAAAEVPTTVTLVRNEAGPPSPPPDGGRLAEDRRLATLHLRLGAFTLARAELERLAGHGDLEPAGLADLAEARWRSGELEAAAAAAAGHLAAGGTRPIARVIAAEAAAAGGRPAEAKVHVDALGAVQTGALEQLFAGMPRRAFWPSVPTAAPGPPDATTGAAPGTAAAGGLPAGHDRVGAGDRGAGPARGGGMPVPHPRHPGALELPGDEPTMAGLWGDDAAAGWMVRTAGTPPPRSAEPADELATARAELSSGNAGEAARGLTRLGLVLRLDPALAAAVLDAVGPRRDVASLVLRGDACRILGRHLDAEAAFSAAAQALDGPDAPRGP